MQSQSRLLTLPKIGVCHLE